MKPLNVLVTGVGGPVGQGIIRAAQQSRIPCRVIATDRDPLSVGFHWADSRYLLPNADHPDYLPQLAAICQIEGVHALFPGSESELLALAQHRDAFQAETRTRLVVSSPEVLAIATDKWRTVQFLARHGLPHPDSALANDPAALAALQARQGFPLLVKPRHGSGSRGVHVVHSPEELTAALKGVANPVVQEYLRPADQEYTVAVFVDGQGQPQGAIVMRRTMVAGLTYRAWVEENPVVAEACQAIAAALKPLGPCNVQLRVTERGPVPFEINARLSSTVAMRAHFGYNEVEMALRSLVLGQPIQAATPKAGIALRYWTETYIDQQPEIFPVVEGQAGQATVRPAPFVKPM